jgi:ABC-type amino acid transport substrate-binding protein
LLYKHILRSLFVTCLVIHNLSAQAKKLLLLTDDAPPHIIASSNTGIDIDITKAVLAKMTYDINIEIMPLRRGKQQVIEKKADLFLPTFFEQDSDKLFISDAIINYQPTIFSRSADQLTLTSISDLTNKSIVTFQGASGYFGDEFLALSQDNKKYRELHDMSKFPEMLLKKRCDVVILDYYIFYYFLQQSAMKNKNSIQISSHMLIPSVAAHVGFHDAALRDSFNQHLAKFKKGKEYRKIIEKYIGVGRRIVSNSHY